MGDKKSSIQETKYPSKQDRWIFLSIWGAAVVLLLVAIGVLVIPAPPLFKVALFVICLVSTGLSLWILYGTYYYFTETQLIARAGPFRYRVPLMKITKVEPSHSPLSAPACSLDRLHIGYEGSWFGLLVSPRDDESFLSALLEFAPQLERQGEMLQKKADVSS